MPASIFIVRAVVVPHLREKFDHWYATDHLPRAMKDFKCEKGWRAWSDVEEGVHYAFYQFTDKPALDRMLASPEFKDIVADFSRNWPEGVTRTRDCITLAQEMGTE